jgi:hypothetical protein
MIASIKIRPVMAGDDYVLQVEGGFVRRTVPEDGLVVESDEREIFVPENKLLEALQRLEARRPQRARPHRVEQLELKDPPKEKTGR